MSGEHVEVLLDQREPLGRNRAVSVRERLTDAERVGELEPEAAGSIEGRGQIPLERLEPARRPLRRFAVLGAAARGARSPAARRVRCRACCRAADRTNVEHFLELLAAARRCRSC